MFTADDLRQMNQLIQTLKRAQFEKLTGPEVLSVALSIQWVSDLKAKIEQSLKPIETKEVMKPEPKKGAKK